VVAVVRKANLFVVLAGAAAAGLVLRGWLGV
jgi:hypothetical protein